MAAIRKRGDNWQVQVRRRGFAPLSRTFSQRRDAERWGVLKEREFDLLESQGQVGAKACDLNVGDLLERYCDQVLLKRNATREASNVRRMIRLAEPSRSCMGLSEAKPKAPPVQGGSLCAALRRGAKGWTAASRSRLSNRLRREGAAPNRSTSDSLGLAQLRSDA